MNRRSFLQTSAALSLPLLIPGGRLFAPTGKRVANHVVLCLFAGGVRQLESLQMKEGNLMPNMLKGDLSITNDIRDGMSPLPAPLTKTLSQSGTLFRGFRFKEGPTAHVSAHLCALTGKYFPNGHNPKHRSPHPTLFEYYRKYSNPEKSALQTWWIAERNDPFNICNFSAHRDFGPKYGANYFHPAALMKGNLLQQHPNATPLRNWMKEQETEQIVSCLNRNSPVKWDFQHTTFENTPENQWSIDQYLREEAKHYLEGKFEDPMQLGKGIMNEDLYNIFFAGRILQRFKPELLVVNMMGIDRGHTHFTTYCNNMRKADYGLAWLWNQIQNDPELRDDTILIAVPEHGRNLEPNSLRDEYGRLALDHTSDEMSREIFCLIAGPPDKVKQNQSIQTITGESIDIVPTIAHILGFGDELQFKLSGRVLHEALV